MILDNNKTIMEIMINLNTIGYNDLNSDDYINLEILSDNHQDTVIKLVNLDLTKQLFETIIKNKNFDKVKHFESEIPVWMVFKKTYNEDVGTDIIEGIELYEILHIDSSLFKSDQFKKAEWKLVINK